MSREFQGLTHSRLDLRETSVWPSLRGRKFEVKIVRPESFSIRFRSRPGRPASASIGRPLGKLSGKVLFLLFREQVESASLPARMIKIKMSDRVLLPNKCSVLNFGDENRKFGYVIGELAALGMRICARPWRPGVE